MAGLVSQEEMKAIAKEVRQSVLSQDWSKTFDKTELDKAQEAAAAAKTAEAAGTAGKVLSKSRQRKQKHLAKLKRQS
jgi:hypothetical protein